MPQRQLYHKSKLYSQGESKTQIKVAICNETVLNCNLSKGRIELLIMKRKNSVGIKVKKMYLVLFGRTMALLAGDGQSLSPFKADVVFDQISMKASGPNGF
jgi:hypothetical protein